MIGGVPGGAEPPRERGAPGGRPPGRIRFMDAQRVNLDGFAVENAELGLTALRSPHDPEPSLVSVSLRLR